MGRTGPKPGGLERARAWIVGLTGVLVVVPALINAGLDIYAVVGRLPKTEAERVNVALFKKYFNKQPVAAFPVPIRQDAGTVEVKFSVFDEGDVFIEYGKFTQWFPFPSGPRPGASLSLVSPAVAQEAQSRGFGRYQQLDKLENGLVVRTRTWENGVVESMSLDPRTGDILKSSSVAVERSPAKKILLPKKGSELGVSQIAPIDLDQIRADRRSATTPATKSEDSVTCFTQIGSCTTINPMPIGSRCICNGSSGPVPGVVK
jgi:hypothetical protein